MSRKKRFIKDLSPADEEQLDSGKKYGKSESFRNRCHAILLSSMGYEVGQIAQIFGVRKRTLYTWFNNWEKLGLTGLKTSPGQGRKPKLSLNNIEHVQAVEKATKNAAQKGTNLLQEVTEEISPKGGLSRWTLRRFLLKKKYRWKRLRRITKKKSPKLEYDDILSNLKEVMSFFFKDLIDATSNLDTYLSHAPKVPDPPKTSFQL